MKISDLKNDQAVSIINQGNKSAPAEKAQGLQEGVKAGIAGDKVEISSQSRDLKKIHDVLAQTPDMRSEKVAALKKAVAEGRYQVSAENIAAKMIQEILVESSRE
jgi:negative regulator of flagellin synthesis FlgM